MLYDPAVLQALSGMSQLSLMLHFIVQEALPAGGWQAASFLVLSSLELDFVHSLQWGRRKKASVINKCGLHFFPLS